MFNKVLLFIVLLLLTGCGSSSGGSEHAVEVPMCEQHYDLCKVYSDDAAIPLELLNKYEDISFVTYLGKDVELSRLFNDKASAIAYYEYFTDDLNLVFRDDAYIGEDILTILETFDYETNTLLWLMEAYHEDLEELTCIQTVETETSIETHFAIVPAFYYISTDDNQCYFSSNYYYEMKFYLYSMPKQSDNNKTALFFDHSSEWKDYYP